MSWNVNGCDRSSLVQNVFGPQKTLERKRWRAAGEPGRSDGERGRTPERVAVPGGACPQTHRHHCHHRVSAGAVTSRSSWLRGGRQHAGERLSAPPPSDRKVRVLAVVSLTHSGVGFFAAGGRRWGCDPCCCPPSSSKRKLLTPHFLFLDLKIEKPAQGGRPRLLTADAPLLPPPGRSHFLTACR